MVQKFVQSGREFVVAFTNQRTVSLEKRNRRNVMRRLARSRGDVQQSGARSKRYLGKRLTGTRCDRMVGKSRVRDRGHRSLGHMAESTIIGRTLVPSLFHGKLAACVGVTSKAFCTVVAHCFLPGRLFMRIMTGCAAQSAGARAIAFAQRHAEVVLHQDGLRSGVAIERRLENREHLFQWGSRPEILLMRAGLFHSHIAALMAFHADVIGQPAAQMRGIHDACIGARRQRPASLTLGNMQSARPMAILTTH